MKFTVASLALAGLMAVGVMGARNTVSAQAPKSQWDGIYTEAQAKRGEALYGQNCAQCHGADLGGGEMAPGLAGGEFTSNWNDLSVGDLYERIRVSMPQSAPGSLTRQQNSDILAYVLMKGKAPTGAAELSTDTNTLKAIKYLAAKP